jgi:hypothetical protein
MDIDTSGDIMQHLIEAHRQVAASLLQKVNPLSGHKARSVWLSHGKDGSGEVYQANLYHPPHWHLEEALDGSAEAPEHTPVESGPSGQRWVSIKTDPHGEHYPVRVTDPRHGQWTVTGGVGGRLNGLVMTGLLDDMRYHDLGKTRAIANKKAQEEADKPRRVEADMMARKQRATPSDKVALEEHYLPMHRLQAVDYMAALHNSDEEGARKIINDHPLASKTQFVLQYANGHPGEGMMVYSHTGGVARRLANSLRADGHNASFIDGDSSGLVTIPNTRQSTAGKVHVIHHDGPVETVPDGKVHLGVHVLKTDGE